MITMQRISPTNSVSSQKSASSFSGSVPRQSLRSFWWAAWALGTYLTMSAMQRTTVFKWHDRSLEQLQQSFLDRAATPVDTTNNLAPWQTHRSQDNLECLLHEPISIHPPTKRVADPTQNKTLLESTSPKLCGQLRRTWLYNPPLSPLARRIEAHQTNCSLPVATHYFDNTFGLGAHFILWGQALCNAMEDEISSSYGVGVRMISKSVGPWLWRDQTHCSVIPSTTDNSSSVSMVESPLACYFPNAEQRCNKVIGTSDAPILDSSSVGARDLSAMNEHNVSDPRDRKLYCSLVHDPRQRAEFRAAATEYLFQRVSPLVIQEAKRQIGLIFPNGKVPDDIITVHVRWGDKFWEMDLPPIEEYVEAVQNLTQNSPQANIYLATEDPKAFDAFMRIKPVGWKVFADITLTEIDSFRPRKGNRASWATRNTKGRAGLIALGSLLVAMEANRFVLTTKSNWSTMMDHLRTNIVDPRCNGCTQVIDLRPGVHY